jgi:hypothetical protein
VPIVSGHTVYITEGMKDPLVEEFTVSENRAVVLSAKRTSQKLVIEWRAFEPAAEPELAVTFQAFEQLWRNSGEDLAVFDEDETVEFPLAAGRFDVVVVSLKNRGNMIRARRAREQRSFDIANPLIISPFSSS